MCVYMEVRIEDNGAVILENTYVVVNRMLLEI